jgi:hypothetical protein
MPLYEVAILKQPTPKEAENGASEELVFGPKAVVAADSQSAAISAVMASGEKVDMARSQVLVRPFA